MDEPWRRLIEQEASEAELLSAHAREFIPDGVPASEPVRRALDAAVQGGFARGLRRALAIIDSAENG